jgi:hypothetical protein
LDWESLYELLRLKTGDMSRGITILSHWRGRATALKDSAIEQQWVAKRFEEIRRE